MREGRPGKYDPIGVTQSLNFSERWPDQTTFFHTPRHRNETRVCSLKRIRAGQAAFADRLSGPGESKQLGLDAFDLGGESRSMDC